MAQHEQGKDQYRYAADSVRDAHDGMNKDRSDARVSDRFREPDGRVNMEKVEASRGELEEKLLKAGGGAKVPNWLRRRSS